MEFSECLWRPRVYRLILISVDTFPILARNSFENRPEAAAFLAQAYLSGDAAAIGSGDSYKTGFCRRRGLAQSFIPPGIYASMTHRSVKPNPLPPPLEVIRNICMMSWYINGRSWNPVSDVIIISIGSRCWVAGADFGRTDKHRKNTSRFIGISGQHKYTYIEKLGFTRSYCFVQYKIPHTSWPNKTGISLLKMVKLKSPYYGVYKSFPTSIAGHR